ncbi:MAG: translation elongation factor Ts, partial [Myxococcota bacterium]
IIKAGKKAGRVAAEGLVRVWVGSDHTDAVIVEVNSETDFVARNDQFIELVDKVTEAIGTSGITSMDELDRAKVGAQSVPDYITAQVATIGENIKLRRFQRVSNDGGMVDHYIHAGDQIGVLLEVSSRTEPGAFGRDVAMHVAAMKPKYLSPDDVDEDEAAKQAEIFRAQLAEEGKPEKIIPRIMEGKMAKWRNEHSLLKQAFVKNPDVSVEEFQREHDGLEIVRFVRFEVGEGIEKEESNLADEVAAQLGSS